jgi:hypothetical protein
MFLVQNLTSKLCSRLSGDDLDGEFVRLFQPDIDPAGWGMTTRQWLMRSRNALIVEPVNGRCRPAWVSPRNVGAAFLRGLSFLDRPPARTCDHDLADLDRRIAGHDHSSLHGRKPGTDEAYQHPPRKAVAVRKQFLGGAMRAAGQELQRAALL